MTRYHFQPGTRAIVAFTVTVVLAVGCRAAAFDIAVQSADSMTHLPHQLDQLLPTSLFE
jgi:hypothetical protein